MKFRFIFIITFIAGLILTFQNCSAEKTFAPSIDFQKVGSDGWPYEGKIFVSQSNCSDGTPQAKAKIYSNAASFMVKENCQNLQPPRSLLPSDIQIDPVDSQVVVVLGQPFNLESEGSNPIQFVQKSELWTTSGASSIQSSPMSGALGTGNLIVCPVLYYWTTATSLTNITDNLGNIYRRAAGPVGPQIGISEQYTGEVWYAESSVGGANHQVTATFSNALTGNQHITCYEYSGVARLNSLEMARATYGTNDSLNQCRLDLGQVSPNSTRSLLFVARWGDIEPNLSLGLTDRFAAIDSAADRLSGSTTPYGLGFTCSQPFSSTVIGLTFKAFD